ncbi:aspartate racemase [Alkalihalobacillus alcalophilus ATCC 27647 = CGMCC 1.3604]|uniref:Aspartate racemase n=3 Tax=Alkalihalobacillus alcalophilus TaxID=1445 RepID=A0A4S4K3M2_ALKAL|nr:aspartate racemase [Alkalihalobacillus alcalophilus ATCC 27647 = CGMCC 1.3604]
MGPLATVDLAEKIILLTKVSRDQDHIPLLIYNNTRIPSRVNAIMDQQESPVVELIKTAKVLEKAGVDFIVMPCHTAHYWLEDIQKHIHTPILNMIENTVHFVKNSINGEKQILLLATSGTVKAQLYQKAFQSEDVQLAIPTKKEQKIVASAIDEVKAGYIANNQYLNELNKIIQKYEQKGISAIIGGCTEIPLLFPYIQNKKITKYDPTLMLAKMAVKKAMQNNKRIDKTLKREG